MFKFEKLDVWWKSISFDEEILMLGDKIPHKEQISLGEQLRRASLSISTNIAEGSGREGIKVARYFYNIDISEFLRNSEMRS